MRSRYYAPSLGRFLTSDPSRLERNLYVYAVNNPINRLDPTGLFSRDQIAKSLGVNNFNNVLSYYDLNGEHWGFIAALLRALPGDKLKPEGVAFGPLVEISRKQPTRSSQLFRKIGYDDSLGITFDGMPLNTMIHTGSLSNPTLGPGLSPIWRSDEAIFYGLSDVSNGSAEYVNGSYTTDLPDFWAVSIGISQTPFEGQGMYIMDRFGQSYISFGALVSVGPYPISLTYGEGYIGQPVQSGTEHIIRMLPSQADLRDKIKGVGLCFGISGAVFIGAGTSVCASNQTFVSVFSAGYQAGVSGLINPSVTFPQGLYPNRGWNWVNEARAKGTMRQDLLTMQEVNFTGCEGDIPLSAR